MAVVAELADGRRLEFPDGTDPSVVQATVKKVMAAKPAPAQESPTSLKNIVGAAVEPNISLLTGMVAQPVSGIAGLISGATGGDAADTIRKVSAAMTYEPKSQGGQAAAEVIGKPFEMLSDAATEGGGMASDATGSPAIGAIVNTLLNLAPSLVGLKGKSTPAAVSGAASRRLMQSALKPSTADMKGGKGAAAVQTLLDEGINVTPGGLSKLEGKISGVNDLIAEAISKSNATVKKGDVATYAHDRFFDIQKQVDNAADKAAFKGVYNRFINNEAVPDDVPVQLAQDIKRGTYRSIGDRNYGETKGAALETEKDLARGFKDEIAKAVPEVGPLNARDSAMIQAKGMLEKRVGTAGNANPIGIGGLSPSALNLVAMLLDRSSVGKSLLARALNPGKRSVSDTTAVMATAPQTFGDDMEARQALIEALIGRR